MITVGEISPTICGTKFKKELSAVFEYGVVLLDHFASWQQHFILTTFKGNRRGLDRALPL
jgi:hypothetical protein